jgi:AcrR family transcriptional regulator
MIGTIPRATGHNAGMPPRPAPPRRAALAAATIVDTALRIARAEGIAAVSMRRLAEELDTSPMSLYRHVDDREDLLLQMLDVVADNVGSPPRSGTPRERLRSIMIALHAAFRRDPWVVQVLAVDGLASPRILPVVDAMFAALADAGLSVAQASSAYALLLQFSFGEVLMSHHDAEDSYARRLVRAADPAQFPHLARIVTADRRDYFDDNLDRVLDGLLSGR